MNNWHTSTDPKEDRQGLVYDEKTGKSIAVTYDPEHAFLVAAAPDLLNALDNAETLLREYRSENAVPPALLANMLYEARRAIAKARGY